jgi:hypothetical protein
MCPLTLLAELWPIVSPYHDAVGAQYDRIGCNGERMITV